MVQTEGTASDTPGDEETGKQPLALPFGEDPAGVLPEARRAATLPSHIRVRLDLVGRGALDADALSAIRRFVQSKGNPRGYGFLYEYLDGELTVGMEREDLPPEAFRGDPVDGFRQDLAELVALLPLSFRADLRAVMTLTTRERKLRYAYRLDARRNVTYRAEIRPPDDMGASSDRPRSEWWNDPRFTVPGILVAAVILALLAYLGILKV